MEEFKLVGIILTFLIGIANLVITIRISRKKFFIETITNVRKEYIVDLRELVNEFCIIATTDNRDSHKLTALSYKLKLMMNPANKEKTSNKWDLEAVRLIDSIMKESNNKEVDRFIVLMQSWLSLEWQGMVGEAKKGFLKNKTKDKLRNDAYSNYEIYCKELNL